jgi:hypothetical protein
MRWVSVRGSVHGGSSHQLVLLVSRVSAVTSTKDETEKARTFGRRPEKRKVGGSTPPLATSARVICACRKAQARSPSSSFCAAGAARAGASPPAPPACWLAWVGWWRLRAFSWCCCAAVLLCCGSGACSRKARARSLSFFVARLAPRGRGLRHPHPWGAGRLGWVGGG